MNDIPSSREADMSLAIAEPEYVAAAATDLTKLGSTLQAANAAAATRTTAVVAAAGDEVSTAIAQLFSGHA
jgi:PE family